MNSKDLFTTFCIWLVLAAGFAVLGGAPLESRVSSVAEVTVEAEGRVVASDNGSIRYSYRVGEQTYFGSGAPAAGEPDFDRLEPHNRVKVFYVMGRPEESILEDPDERLESLRRVTIFVTIVGSLVLMIGLYWKGWLPISRRGRI